MTPDTRAEPQDVTIDGDPWAAMMFSDGRYRLFRPDASREDWTYLPGEKGLCSYCLAEGSTSKVETGKYRCRECGETEVIVNATRETVGEVLASSSRAE